MFGKYQKVSHLEIRFFFEKLKPRVKLQTLAETKLSDLNLIEKNQNFSPAPLSHLVNYPPQAG
jgi:hypothetical protein